MRSVPESLAPLPGFGPCSEGVEEAKEGGNNALAHALADGREPIAAYFAETGLELPKARRPRGRRAKTA